MGHRPTRRPQSICESEARASNCAKRSCVHRMAGMDYEPWNEPEDEGWRMPRSWQEVRERWPHDSALRVAVAIAVVLVLAVVLAFLRFAR